MVSEHAAEHSERQCDHQHRARELYTGDQLQQRDNAEENCCGNKDSAVLGSPDTDHHPVGGAIRRRDTYPQQRKNTRHTDAEDK
ncbi:hypothetical protein GCM10027169_17600 [Gordonia jinhuaensis]|uniref:Uncharacterized protein n=1 Tax=Gordonia jinhuaensis TaxID=1517702 RepID=A0A916TLG9_9ACTN|nr:hypothetical protein GCM10011489_38090 [Gordonia jinhuaensis]